MNCSKGVIIGLDASLEYLLPFFYINFRLCSDLPITFFDFGMSICGKEFCQKRGHLVENHATLYEPKNTSFKSLKRSKWFQKPLAFKKAPYDLNLWLDIDCMIRSPLDDLFKRLDDRVELSLIKEGDVTITLHDEEHLITVYNSGVVVFKKNTSLIDDWINLCKITELDNLGDQDLLSMSLYKKKQKIYEIDPYYNFVLDTVEDPRIHSTKINMNLRTIHEMSHYKLDHSKAKIFHFANSMKRQMLIRFETFANLDKNIGTISDYV